MLVCCQKNKCLIFINLIWDCKTDFTFAKLKIQYSYLLIIHGSHVFPGSRWNEIFMWRTWHTLVALNSKRFTLVVYFKRRFSTKNCTWWPCFCRNETKFWFFLHDLIEVFTERLVPIDLLHIPDLILKLYGFSLNFIENIKFTSLYNTNVLNR